jgi:hypothetical protein
VNLKRDRLRLHISKIGTHHFILVIIIISAPAAAVQYLISSQSKNTPHFISLGGFNFNTILVTENFLWSLIHIHTHIKHTHSLSLARSLILFRYWTGVNESFPIILRSSECIFQISWKWNQTISLQRSTTISIHYWRDSTLIWVPNSNVCQLLRQQLYIVHAHTQTFLSLSLSFSLSFCPFSFIVSVAQIIYSFCYWIRLNRIEFDLDTATMNTTSTLLKEGITIHNV